MGSFFVSNHLVEGMLLLYPLVSPKTGVAILTFLKLAATAKRSIGSPITSDQFEGCDYLFLTHGHYDHILDAGKLAARFNPIIHCSQLVSESLSIHLGINSDQIRTVTAGDIVRANGMTVEVIQGTHVDFLSDYKRLTGKEFQPDTPIKEAIETTITKTFETDWRPPRIEAWMEKFPQGEQINFVIQLDQGSRIYNVNAEERFSSGGLPGVVTGTSEWERAFTEYMNAHGFDITIYPFQALGNFEEASDMMRQRLLQYCTCGPFPFFKTSPVVFGGLIPYLFNDLDHHNRFIRSKGGYIDKVNETSTKAGV